MAKKSVDTEKYAGSGRLGSAVGESNLYGIGVGLAGAGASAAVGAGMLSNSGPLVTRLAAQLTRFGIPMAGKTAAVLGLAYAGAAIGSLLGTVSGLFIGVNKASKAKQQFNQLKTERDMARSQLQGVAMVMSDPAQGRRFADTIQSRGTRGSYAETVQAEKATSAKRDR